MDCIGSSINHSMVFFGECMSESFWITFNHRRDLLGAKVEGDKATVYWNKAEPREKTLKRHWTYQEVGSMHPNNIRQGIFQVAGIEHGLISNVKIFQEDVLWEDYLKEKGL